MARPIKNYCDYFPHDRDMRNHRKIKAVRTKFGIEGYAIWSMLLEYLTGIDGNVFEYSEPEFELIGGDFGVSVETIRLVVDYCLKLELLFLKDGFVNSESLDERLKPVYVKRGISKNNSQKQQRKDGKFVNNNTVSDGVSVAEKPQSKVNKNKVNKKEEKIDYAFDSEVFKKCFDDWIVFRKEKKKELTPSTIARQKAMLQKYTEDIAIRIIEKSILNGWSGLFELKEVDSGSSFGKNSGRQKTAYELDLEQKRLQAASRIPEYD
jgi:hypothetical protein